MESIMPQIRTFAQLFIITLLFAVTPNLVARSSEAGPSPRQDPITVVAVTPALVSMSVGDTVDVQVVMENPHNVYAFDVRLTFETSVIQIEDADASAAGVQVRLGALFGERQHFVANNRVDNAAGTIHVVASLLGAEAPINTDGNILSITLRADANGTSPLSLTQVLLVDNNAATVPANSAGATILVGTDTAVTPGPTPAASPTPASTSAPSTSPTPIPTGTGVPDHTPTPSANSPTPDLTSIPTGTGVPDHTPTPSANSPTTPTPRLPATSTATPQSSKLVQLSLIVYNYRRITPILNTHIQLPLILYNHRPRPAISQ
jgi:hypothetical protein